MIRIYPLALLSLLCVPFASAQDFSGKQVVVIMDGARLMDKKDEVSKASLGEVFLVEKVNGPWLFIRDRAGWIQAKDVVLFEQAEGHFTREIQKSPSARNHYQRGMIRLMQRKVEPAIDDFSQVIKLEPKLAAAYGLRAGAHHDRGELDLAIADYDAAIRLEPKDPIAYHNRAFAWQDKREFDKAIADCDEAIRLDPNFAAAYNNRGLAWYSKGELDKAIADYDKAYALDSTHVVSLNNRGNARMKKGDFVGAIDDFTAVLKVFPRDLWAFTSRGDAYRRSGQFSQAIADYRSAMQINPKAPLPHTTLAWLLATCPDESYRNAEEGVSEGMAACELSRWKDHRALDALAAAQAEAGNFDEAIKHQEKAIELAPDAVRDTYQSRLARYRENEPYRETSES